MPQPDYDALAQQHGGVDYDALAAAAGGSAAASDPAPAMNFATVNGERVPVDDSPLDFVAGVAHNVNPLPAMQAVGKALIPEAAARAIGASDAETYGPVNAAKGLLEAQNHVKAGADEAWNKGDYATAIRKYADWLLPIIGPAIDASADKMANGQPFRGAGEAVGLGLSIAGPKALENAQIKVPAAAPNRNPVEAAAVQFGEQRGVPIDAATATGNPFVRNIQKATANTPLGSRPAMRMQAEQSAALERVGGDLAGQAYGVSATPETAGARVNEALRGKIEAHAQYAEHAYQTLEKIAHDPKNLQTVTVGAKTVPTGEMDAQGFPTYKKQPITEKIAIPVDLRGVKAALKPIYESIARSLPVTQRQASAGFQALENIVNGKDYAPMLQTERDLGALKEIARGADLPELRTISQGLGAQGVQRLQAAVDAAAAKAGPKALQALKDGRASTAEKFATADVWDRIRAEPVQAFRQATAPRDAGIDLLRQVQQQAPQVTAQLARAWIDQLLTKATTEGGFQRAQRLQNTWLELGPETKKILFPQKGQIQALDNYFRLARMIAENPNPSGTALTASSLASVQGLFFAPTATIGANAATGAIAKILHSPKAVQLFTRGTTLMLGPGKASKAALSAGIADVIRAAREAGVPTSATPAPGLADPTAPQGQP